MPFLDFTLNNPKIRSYLEGTSDLAPVGELMYIHTHFVQHNFLSELEVMVNMTGEILVQNPNKKGIALKLKSLAERFGVQISSITEKSAPEILATLKQIYQLCKVILK